MGAGSMWPKARRDRMTPEVEREEVQARLHDISRHEAAHLVVARSLGFETEEVKVRANSDGGADGGSSVILDRRLPTLDDVRTYLRERICVLLAGAIADTMLPGMVDRALAQENLKTLSKDDHSKIRELEKVLAGVECGPGDDFATVLARVQIEGWERSERLVLRYEHLIEELANLLRSDSKTFDEWAIVEGWDRPTLGDGR